MRAIFFLCIIEHLVRLSDSIQCCLFLANCLKLTTKINTVQAYLSKTRIPQIMFAYSFDAPWWDQHIDVVHSSWHASYRAHNAPIVAISPVEGDDPFSPAFQRHDCVCGDVSNTYRRRLDWEEWIITSSDAIGKSPENEWCIFIEVLLLADQEFALHRTYNVSTRFGLR